jgi:hypothetical protein
VPILNETLHNGTGKKRIDKQKMDKICKKFEKMLEGDLRSPIIIALK